MEDTYGKDYFPVLWGQWCDAYKAIGDQEKGEICSNLLPLISCPTLIIHGDKDPMVDPAHPEYLNKNIAGSRFG